MEISPTSTRYVKEIKTIGIIVSFYCISDLVVRNCKSNKILDIKKTHNFYIYVHKSCNWCNKAQYSISCNSIIGPKEVLYISIVSSTLSSLLDNYIIRIEAGFLTMVEMGTAGFNNKTLQ